MVTFTIDRRRLLSVFGLFAGFMLLQAGSLPARALDANGIDVLQPPGVTAPAQPPAHGMVVAQERIAAQVGQRILELGGNAVDAAVATGFAMAVTYPVAGNIGGGGFMVIRFPDGRATTIDFRERAPAAATPEMFTDSAGNYSPKIHHASLRAVGVPGTVA